MPYFSNLVFEAEIAARSFWEFAKGGALRLGVTGLSRAGKTVFVTAMIENLIAGTRLPVLAASAQGRLSRARLAPQPDDEVPRFPYELHIEALSGARRHWPDSTRRISELRLTLEFERLKRWGSGPSELHIDIVDYPGEWLLDLPLLEKSYAQWSRETLEAARAKGREALSADWTRQLASMDPNAPADEDRARSGAASFTDYLRRAREESYSLSTLPPGRFLMPGDLEGSPALTFSPLAVDEDVTPPAGSQAAMMARRYESYKAHVVRPFFRDHFSRLDRQIVLVDALSALNSGPAALRDLERALGDVLNAFRAGRSSTLSTMFRPRVNRILFAATKADALHHTSHDRLEALLRLLTRRAISRAEDLGAEIDVIALAAVRSTREVEIRGDGEILEAIVGVPEQGQSLGGEAFDGISEAAVFPGELPEDPASLLEGDALALPEAENDWRFLKFRPPVKVRGRPAPHIRLDRALQFLIGDRLA